MEQIEKVFAFLEKQDVHKSATVTQRKLANVEKRLKVKKIRFEQQVIPLTIELPQSISAQKLKEVREALTKEGITYRVKIEYDIGKPFKNYGQVDTVAATGVKPTQKKTTLAHKEGEVLLVYIWQESQEQSVKIITHIQRLLVEHGNWNKRVRVVAIAVDKEKQKVTDAIKYVRLEKILHTVFSDVWQQSQIVKDYKIEQKQVPFLIVVDKKGIINWVGHPMQLHIQDKINELLGQKDAKKQENQLQKVDLAKMESLLSKEKLTSQLQAFDNINIKYAFKKIYKHDKSFQAMIRAHAFIPSVDKEGQQKASAYMKSKGITSKIVQVEYITIPYVDSPQCYLCKQKISAFPYYWLPFEDNQKSFGCRKCIEAKPDEKTYAYNNNSVFLVDKWPYVAKMNLGVNIQPEKPAQSKTKHNFACNICSENSKKIGDPRYVCLGCRSDPCSVSDYVDTCVNCFEKIPKEDKAAHDKLAEKDEHVMSHPWLRILYAQEGYYEF